MTTLPTQCPCCGGTEFSLAPVLWAELIAEWELEPDEVEYVDRQQGETCVNCEMKLRSRMLATAFMDAYGYKGLFKDFVTRFRKPVLELNEAGSLTEFLKRLSSRTLAEYPNVDIAALPYRDNTFEVVLHSDTLEHVPDPVAALRECRRVLRPGGFLLYTVPVIVGRLTRRRDGLPPSYHGGRGDEKADYLVHTEYGSDVWTEPLLAGFTTVRITSTDVPASLVISAQK